MACANDPLGLLGRTPAPDAPMIWTTRGNLPASELRYATRWEFVPGEYVKFVETYTAADGAVVKESAHVLTFKTLTGEAVAQTI